jgi:hypothetical protein
VVSFVLRCRRCLQLLQSACLVSGRSVAAGAWQRSRQADLKRKQVMQAIRDQQTVIPAARRCRSARPTISTVAW